MSKVTSLDFARVFKYIPSDDILGYPSPTCSAFMWILMGFFFYVTLDFWDTWSLGLDSLLLCYLRRIAHLFLYEGLLFLKFLKLWRYLKIFSIPRLFSSLARFLIKLNSLSVSSTYCLLFDSSLSVYGTSVFCKTLVHLDLTLNSSIKGSSNFRLLDSSVSILQRLLDCAFF